MTGFFNEVKAKLRYFARFTLLHPYNHFTVTITKPLHFLYQRPNALGLCISLIKWKNLRRYTTPQLLKDVFLIYYSLAPILYFFKFSSYCLLHDCTCVSKLVSTLRSQNALANISQHQPLISKDEKQFKQLIVLEWKKKQGRNRIRDTFFF